MLDHTFSYRLSSYQHIIPADVQELQGFDAFGLSRVAGSGGAPGLPADGDRLVDAASDGGGERPQASKREPDRRASRLRTPGERAGSPLGRWDDDPHDPEAEPRRHPGADGRQPGGPGS